MYCTLLTCSDYRVATSEFCDHHTQAKIDMMKKLQAKVELAYIPIVLEEMKRGKCNYVFNDLLPWNIKTVLCECGCDVDDISVDDGGAIELCGYNFCYCGGCTTARMCTQVSWTFH